MKAYCKKICLFTYFIFMLIFYNILQILQLTKAVKVGLEIYIFSASFTVFESKEEAELTTGHIM